MAIKKEGDTALALWLRSATPDERTRCADIARTSVAYLYQLAAVTGSEPKVGLALRIARATKKLSAANKRLPRVEIEDLVRYH